MNQSVRRVEALFPFPNMYVAPNLQWYLPYFLNHFLLPDPYFQTVMENRWGYPFVDQQHPRQPSPHVPQYVVSPPIQYANPITFPAVPTPLPAPPVMMPSPIV